MIQVLVANCVHLFVKLIASLNNIKNNQSNSSSSSSLYPPSPTLINSKEKDGEEQHEQQQEQPEDYIDLGDSVSLITLSMI